LGKTVIGVGAEVEEKKFNVPLTKPDCSRERTQDNLVGNQTAPAALPRAEVTLGRGGTESERGRVKETERKAVTASISIVSKKGSRMKEV